MQSLSFTAACLCGDVEFKVKLVDLNLGVCHCSMCRKATGGTGFSFLYSETRPIFKSEAQLRIYDSINIAERGFCQNCGTPIFYHRKSDTGYCIPPAIIKVLPEEKVIFSKEWYLENKPVYYNYKEH